MSYSDDLFKSVFGREEFEKYIGKPMKFYKDNNMAEICLYNYDGRNENGKTYCDCSKYNQASCHAIFEIERMRILSKVAFT